MAITALRQEISIIKQYHISVENLTTINCFHAQLTFLQMKALVKWMHNLIHLDSTTACSQTKAPKQGVNTGNTAHRNVKV
jgi:hypothetical protein